MAGTLGFLAWALAAAVPGGSQVRLAKSGVKLKLIKEMFEDRVSAINPNLVNKIDAEKTDEAWTKVTCPPSRH